MFLCCCFLLLLFVLFLLCTDTYKVFIKVNNLEILFSSINKVYNLSLNILFPLHLFQKITHIANRVKFIYLGSCIGRVLPFKSNVYFSLDIHSIKWQKLIVLHLIQRTKLWNCNLKQYNPENSAFRPVNKSCLGHCYPVSPWANYPTVTLYAFEFSLLFSIHNICFLIKDLWTSHKYKHFVQITWAILFCVINMGNICDYRIQHCGFIIT